MITYSAADIAWAREAFGSRPDLMRVIGEIAEEQKVDGNERNSKN